MNKPINEVLYNVASDIVTSLRDDVDSIGHGHLAENAVIHRVQLLLMKQLREAGFVRVEQLDASPSIAALHD